MSLQKKYQNFLKIADKKKLSKLLVTILICNAAHLYSNVLHICNESRQLLHTSVLTTFKRDAEDIKL